MLFRSRYRFVMVEISLRDLELPRELLTYVPTPPREDSRCISAIVSRCFLYTT